ncbi:hypothetical protein ACN077_20575 [Clostridium chromiireducens]|uniref:hypothetical protein n=1 Tax=Clostridium chromiireducens TaxID=225345 RepID=UPI003AF5285F
MKKIIIKQDRLSRENLCNSFPNNTLHERLIKSNAIDYTENYFVEDLGHNYIRISPKDKTKLLR